MLQIGTLRMRVAAKELQLAQKTGAKVSVTKASQQRNRRRSRDVQPPEEGQEADRFVAVQTSTNTCDLRGMRVEEALDQAEAFLDKAYQREMGAAYLIHGHGTGALREAIRDLCRRSPYVMSHRAGDGEEGGNGVTVVRVTP